MWIVIKFNKKEINLLKKDLKSKLGEEVKFFLPKIKFQKLKNNRLFNEENFLLGNYLICFHPSFENVSLLNNLKYCKGLSYFLRDFCNSQKEIIAFINKCKNHQDDKGYIKQSFFNFGENHNFKFMSGPFTNMIFKILEKQKNSIKILVRDCKLTVLRNKYLFKPI